MPEEITVPADLKVAIWDERAADSITPAGMKATLSSYGWRHEWTTPGAAAEIWQRDGARDHDAELWLPMFPAAPDYAKRVLILIGDLEKQAGRSQLAVWADLRSASQEGDGDEG